MGGPRLTDGGLETSLIFQQGLDLPHFAAFPLVDSADGRTALRAYWEPYLDVAAEHGTGFVVDTATWRASSDWGARLGYDPRSLAAANEAATAFARDLANGADDALVNGVVGPRGDGYAVGDVMSPEEAADYHAPQVAALAHGGVDRVSAITMTYAEEAIGFMRAAIAVGVPAVVSFTVETDGRLPSGQPLREAIEAVDEDSGATASFFMVNCAHPTHFAHVLDEDGPWLARIGGIRANASRMSHAELDMAEELDSGDPADLAERYRELRDRLPAMQVLGGCCGTDHRHVTAISGAWRRP
jgi:homocysteine S-methyltransferase